MRGVALLIVLLLAIGLAISQTSTPSHIAALKNEPAKPVDHFVEQRSRRQIATESLAIKDFRWNKSDFGIMTATFTFVNASDYDIKDVEVRCDHSGPSGTTIDSNTKTIYEVVPARGSKTIRNFNMGFVHSQASRSGCRVLRSVAGDYRSPPEANTGKTGPASAEVPIPLPRPVPR